MSGAHLPGAAATQACCLDGAPVTQRCWKCTHRDDVRARTAIDTSLSERAFQGQVEQLAQLCGWLYYHTFRSDHSQPGFPDLVLLRGEQVLFRELKRQDGKLSRAQEQWRDALIAAGCDWRMWKPSDWPSIEMCLKGERR